MALVQSTRLRTLPFILSINSPDGVVLPLSDHLKAELTAKINPLFNNDPVLLNGFLNEFRFETRNQVILRETTVLAQTYILTNFAGLDAGVVTAYSVADMATHGVKIPENWEDFQGGLAISGNLKDILISSADALSKIQVIFT